MKQWMRSALQIGLGGSVLVVAVIWLSGGFGDRISPDDVIDRDAGETAAEQVVEVMAIDALRLVPVSGTISSSRHTTVSAKILARIESSPVAAGDVVEQGDIVVTLDSRDLTARLEAAREQVTAARASLELAQSERKRIEGLHAEQIASQQQLDHARTNLAVATAELERAARQVIDAEVGLSHGEIRAPVGGRVVDRLAEAGDTASPGVALLRIYDPGAMRLEAPVREGLATRLRPGQAVRVQVEALDLELEGEIDEIVAAAEPGARTFLVKVRLPADLRLYSGMFGRALIPAGKSRALTVPAEAISRIGQLEFAAVVDDRGRVHRRMVTTGGRLDDERIEVLSGLASGERVALP
jgi:membrane fusion protein (multidrug efflux system)